ncbi:hypothetical protein GGTG_10854 [Gaeumannomyces tritici R3-111a-1]|uniref:Uncharacterized protein n=1 Tax=Gaeumannomyces tritici (strain R3-111a-1) TaxID=644352 RepID=J3PBI2_GAET3|nr:hypothetical protein GGTG_10854 [Gaeumannomyces tritici R3-111a-1]EJT71599.1 hypothetical protein GGTG_10854 [Gaeumannomyces tritici R3-111a-1]
MVRALGWAFAALLSGVSANRLLWDRQSTYNSTHEPCQVARKAAEFGMGSRIKPSLALACLASAPLNLDRDIELIDSLIPYVEQQSTIGYLKNPPDSYLYPPIDLIGGLKQIKEKLRAGGYRSQLDFAWEVNAIYNQVYDGHFDYRPALLTVFGFQVSRSLVSVSKDGIELPKVYDAEDLRKQAKSKHFEPSEVVSIDGLAIVEYLQIVAANSALQDPDAQYNNLFSSPATLARGGGRYFTSGGYVELPDSSIYKYANGSVKSFPNYAVIQQDLTDIENGRDLHLAYEIPAPEKAAVSSSLSVKATATTTWTTSSTTGTTTATTTTNSSSGTTTSSSSKAKATKASKNGKTKAKTSKTPAAAPTVVGYPYPVVKHYNDYIAGYFLNETEYKDVAVLSIFSFSPKAGATRTTREFHEFRRVVRTFISECRKAKRTKLIIDVQANGGGLLFQSYELYRNLFPKADPPFDGTRIRATDAWDVIGKDVYGTKQERSAFNNILDKDLKRYADWKAVQGPFATKEDKFSSILRYNFTKADTVGEPGFVVSGYGPDDSPPEPHFEAKDIVLVTDGFCASTCTILARMLTHHQKIKTLALGGRPLKAPMQIVGGVKGAQVIKYNIFQQMLSNALRQLAPGAAGRPEGLPRTDRDLPLMPLLASLQFNFRNAYRDADAQVPQQFVYEASHCRRFYTYDMTRKPAEAWKVAADVAFRGGKCVEGSSTGSDGTLGTEPPRLDRDKVRAKHPAYDGPGSRAYADRRLPEAKAGTRRWEAAARRASRRDLDARGLSAHDLALINRRPKEVPSNGWWDHTGF